MSTTTTTSEYVDLFERGGGWVAAGDAEQWMATHERLQTYVDNLIEERATHLFETTITLHDIDRAERIRHQAWNNSFTADQWGRMSTELFSSEAEIIKAALA